MTSRPAWPTVSDRHPSKRKKTGLWDMAQLVECVPSMHKALGSNLSPLHTCLDDVSLQCQHLGGRGRRIRGSKPAWAT